MSQDPSLPDKVARQIKKTDDLYRFRAGLMRAAVREARREPKEAYKPLEDFLMHLREGIDFVIGDSTSYKFKHNLKRNLHNYHNNSLGNNIVAICNKLIDIRSFPLEETHPVFVAGYDAAAEYYPMIASADQTLEPKAKSNTIQVISTHADKAVLELQLQRYLGEELAQAVIAHINLPTTARITEVPPLKQGQTWRDQLKTIFEKIEPANHDAAIDRLEAPKLSTLELIELRLNFALHSVNRVQANMLELYRLVEANEALLNQKQNQSLKQYIDDFFAKFDMVCETKKARIGYNHIALAPKLEEKLAEPGEAEQDTTTPPEIAQDAKPIKKDTEKEYITVYGPKFIPGRLSNTIAMPLLYNGDTRNNDMVAGLIFADKFIPMNDQSHDPLAAVTEASMCHGLVFNWAASVNHSKTASDNVTSMHTVLRQVENRQYMRRLFDDYLVREVEYNRPKKPKECSAASHYLVRISSRELFDDIISLVKDITPGRIFAISYHCAPEDKHICGIRRSGPRGENITFREPNGYEAVFNDPVDFARFYTWYLQIKGQVKEIKLYELPFVNKLQKAEYPEYEEFAPISTEAKQSAFRNLEQMFNTQRVEEHKLWQGDADFLHDLAVAKLDPDQQEFKYKEPANEARVNRSAKPKGGVWFNRPFIYIKHHPAVLLILPGIYYLIRSISRYFKSRSDFKKFERKRKRWQRNVVEAKEQHSALVNEDWVESPYKTSGFKHDPLSGDYRQVHQHRDMTSTTLRTKVAKWSRPG